MTNSEVFRRVEQAGVLAVLILDEVDDAAPVAEALIEGGVTAMELTLRSEAALPAIRDVRKFVPEMLIGAGTVLAADQVRAVADAGAAFAVSPGLNRAVLQAASDANLPFAPGVATPSDVEAALVHGCRLLKFFPAELLGGLPYLRTMAAPYNHLGVKYVPLGGVKQSNLAEYLDDPLIAAVGGSWLAPRDLIAAKDWAAVRKHAEPASATVAAR